MLADTEGAGPYIDRIAAIKENDPEINPGNKPAGMQFPDGLMTFVIKKPGTFWRHRHRHDHPARRLPG